MLQVGRDENLRDLAAQKQQEWRDLEKLRTQSLESAVNTLEKTLQEEKSKFQKLKEDFKYNLKLLGERDAELEKYDSVYGELRSCITEKEGKISELHIRIADLELCLSRDSQSKDEMQKHYQQRIREKHAEIERYKREHDAQIEQERQEIEALKRNVERQVLELEEELDNQRRELTTGFDTAAKKREHEFRMQTDDLSSQLLAQQLKVKLLSQEIEIFKGGDKNQLQEIESTEEKCRDLEKQLKQKQWQLDDLTAINNAKLQDMQRKVDSAEACLKRSRLEFERKQSELDSRAKEKEQIVNQLKASADEYERTHREETRQLQSQFEELQTQHRQLQWEKEDCVKEAGIKVETLQEEINHLKTVYERRAADLSSSRTTTEQELEGLRSTVSELKVQVEGRKRDIERYKRDLSAAADRELALQQEKSQIELDWQRRYEAIENQQYEKAEDLVKTLTKARDEALADSREKQRELEHNAQLIQVLTEEREQALSTLKQHGITLDRDCITEEELPPSAAPQIQDLQQQNDNLRQVIKTMRTDMENIGKDARTKPDSVAKEYVANLEAELADMKSTQSAPDKLRMLEVQAGGSKDVGGDNLLVRSHVDALNDTIGQLRSEKVELMATVRKQQAQLQHLQATNEQLVKNPQERESTLAELQYQMGASERRHQAQILGLQQQVSHLQSQLTEAHSLADSYHKAATEANMENTSLRQQVSAVKMEVAEGRPAVNYGAQELLIQQLQDEVQHLRKRIAGQDSDTSQSYKGGGSSVQEGKLKQAVKQIAKLAKEKQQLIEVGNRLRAQLNSQQSNTEPPTPPYQPTYTQNLHHTGGGPLQSKINNKLRELEKLQYNLTKQELALHKKEAPVKLGMPPAVLADSEEITSSVNEEEVLPKPILKKRSATSSSSPMSDQPYQSQSAKDPLVMSSMSSVGGGSSLQEVWQMLDHGDTVSSSGFPSPQATLNMRSARTLDIQGKQAPLKPKPKPVVRSPPTKQRPSSSAKTTQKSQIRNWNVKDYTVK